MPRRTQVALLATTLALAAPVAAQAEPYQHVTQPVAVWAESANSASAIMDRRFIPTSVFLWSFFCATEVAPYRCSFSTTSS